MNKLELLKDGVEILTSIGVGSIVGNAIKVTTHPDTGKIKKIIIGFGGFVLSNMVGDLASDYASKRIDDIADRVTTIAEKVKKQTQINEETKEKED